ncbi:hypothetical protein GW17_00003645, partial [Ensete ventricosum]
SYCFVFAAPATTRCLPDDYVESVKRVHESGGHGSKGYVIMLIFEMHIIMILMKPCFLLSYGYDWKREEAEKNLLRTHTTAVSTRMLYKLAQQITPKVANPSSLFLTYIVGTLSNLVLLHSYHEGLKKWVEVGNSGMFRPEMLLPMGLPKDVNVIAWGLSLER